ncbi:MAG: NADH-quinone oxidoreductase subunit N [Planctomycetota bacterium]|jgi:NADH-quinone oxidoreductase subunit N
MEGLLEQSKPLSPVIVMFLGAFVAILTGTIAKREQRVALPYIALCTIGLALVLLFNFWKGSDYLFFGALKPDAFSSFVGAVVLIGAGLAVLVSIGYAERADIGHGEYYGLLLTAAGGMMLLAMSQDYVTLFISLEITSIPIYVLTGISRERRRSGEGALKYLILGAFSTAFFLFGIALIYGITGKTAISPVGVDARLLPLFITGLALLSVGLLFKLGAAPFHVWVPDAYEGAPAPVTAFMSVAVKAAAFGAFLRILLVAFPAADLSIVWWKLLWGVALLTLILGNFIAIYQRNVKRMLAYSGIAHSGYILVALAAQGASLSEAGNIGLQGVTAILFYLFTYTFMTAGAFAVIALSVREDEDLETLEDFAGLAKRRPLIAAAMGLFLVSLAGVPPLGGFMAKFFVFKAAIQTGSGDLVWLAVLGILTSMASLYYYLRVLVYMYFREPATSREAVEPAWGTHFALFLCTVAILFLGILPNKIWQLASMGAASLNLLQG